MCGVPVVVFTLVGYPSARLALMPRPVRESNLTAVDQVLRHGRLTDRPVPSVVRG